MEFKPADAQRAPQESVKQPSRRLAGSVWRELLFAVAVILFAWSFSERHIRLPQWPDVDFAHLVDGSAKTPMQYRVLLPWVVRAARDSDVWWLSRWTLGEARFALNVLSCTALLYAIRWFWSALGSSRRHAMAASGLVALVLPYQYLLPGVRFHYVYDIPAVAFFTLGLAALAARRWGLFYAVFILGTFNRETTAFLVPAYLLVYAGRDTWTRLAGHAAAQTAVWVAIKTLLWVLYGDNTDPVYANRFDLFKDSLHENLELFRRYPKAVWLAMASNWGYLWIPAFAGWRQIGQPFVRRALLIVPVFVGAMFYMGEIHELRIYGELIPIVAAAAFWVLVQPGAAADAIRATADHDSLARAPRGPASA